MWYSRHGHLRHGGGGLAIPALAVFVVACGGGDSGEAPADAPKIIDGAVDAAPDAPLMGPVGFDYVLLDNTNTAFTTCAAAPAKRLRLSLGSDLDLNGSLETGETVTSAEIDCAHQEDLNTNGVIDENEAGRFSATVAVGTYSHAALEVLDVSAVPLSWAQVDGLNPSTRRTFGMTVVVSASQAAEIDFTGGVFTIAELAIQLQ